MSTPGVADLYVVGAPRCGTTWSYHALADHPQVAPCEVKEPTFFGADLDRFRDAQSARRTIEEYRASFPTDCDDRLRMEASPSYLYSHQAIAEIDRANPRARFIALVRNPIERIASHHQLRLANAVELDIRLVDALDHEICILGQPRRPRQATRGFPYVGMTRYAEQLERAFDTVGRDRVHVVVHDDLRRDPRGVYRDLLAFCGLDDHEPPDVTRPRNAIQPARSPRFGRFLRFAPAPARAVVRAAIPSRRFRVRLKHSLVRANLADRRPPPTDPAASTRIAAALHEDVARLQRLLDRSLAHWFDGVHHG